MLKDTHETLDEMKDSAASEPYVVHLPYYDGPLALLLHLIEKRQLEISTISLVAVTGQYLEYLRHYEEHQHDCALSLSRMTEFVSVAARLLLIKAQSLLPLVSPDEDSQASAERAAILAEDLQRHLIEYKAIKEIAHVLNERVAAGLQSYGRSRQLADIEAHLAWTPPVLSGLSAQTLGQTFQRLLEEAARRGEATGSELLPVARVRVNERIAVIRTYLERTPRVSLSSILRPTHSRLVYVVTFLAILELWKWQRIDIQQEEPMGPIELSRGALWDETWLELVDD